MVNWVGRELVFILPVHPAGAAFLEASGRRLFSNSSIWGDARALCLKQMDPAGAVVLATACTVSLRAALVSQRHRGGGRDR